MKIIGMVYTAPFIEELLSTQTATEIISQGMLVGLAFAPTKSKDGFIDNLEIYKVYFQPNDTPESELGGLSPEYYGKVIKKTVTPLQLELGNFETADEFLSQPPVSTEDSIGLEFSKEIIQGDLLNMAFSFFGKEDLLSHISEMSHLIISGAKFIPGKDGVRISDSVIRSTYFNLKIQNIIKTGADKASSFELGNIIGQNTTLSGAACPRVWVGLS